MRTGPRRLEQLPLSGAGESQEDPDDSWLVVLGLLLAGTGEPWNSSGAAWLGVLLSAPRAGARLLPWHPLGRL